MESKSKVSLAPIPRFLNLYRRDIVMNEVQRKIKQVYELYGYVPFDTQFIETDRSQSKRY